MVWFFAQAEMPRELKLWMILILLVILLLVGVGLALVLGRMLGPRGPWARMDRRLAAKMREPSEAPDAWEESAKRMRVEAEADNSLNDDADPFDDEDEEDEDNDFGGYRY